MKWLSIASLVVTAAFWTGSAYALTCQLRSNVNDGQVVDAPFRVEASVECSDLEAPDSFLTYLWAPPMIPATSQSGWFILDFGGSNVGPVGVTELGNCTEGNRELVCNPTEPGCGRDGRSIPLFDQKKFRGADVYKSFKKVFVPESKNGKDLTCEVLDQLSLDPIFVTGKIGCEPNCFAPPVQAPQGFPLNAPCPVPPSPAELPVSVPGTDPVSFPSCDRPITSLANPVNAVTGAMWHQNTDFVLKGRTKNTGISLTRTYTAAPVNRRGAFGYRWQFGYETSIARVPGVGQLDLDWIDETGGPNRYLHQANGSFQRPVGQAAVLRELPDHYELQKSDRTVLFFFKTNGPFGRLYKIRDVYGESVDLVYDDNDRLESISSPFTGVVAFTYNSLNLVSSVTRVRDNLTYNYTYDSKFRLASVRDYRNREYSYSYVDDKESLASNGLLETITDPIGRRLVFTYDHLGRSNNQFEPLGGVWKFQYGDKSTKVTGPNGSETLYSFDENFREVKRVTADGGKHFKAWTDGRLTAIRSEFGGTSKWTYDSNGNATSGLGAGDQVAKRTTYDLNFNVPIIVLPAVGEASEFELDPITGDVKQLTRGGLSLQFTYDSFGNLLTTYNGKTNYSNQRNADGLLTFIYDAFNPQTLTYDIRGREISRTFLSGRVLTKTYNDDDQVLVFTDSHGYIFEKTYDPAGRMLTGTLGTGTSTLGYDGFGRKNSIVHSDGASGSFQRDLLDRITQVTWTGPTPISLALGYDLAGNITQLERENSSASTIAHDAVNQILSSTGGSIEARSFTLDPLGNRLQDSVNGAGSFVSNFLTSNGTASFLADPNGFGDLVQETKAGVTKNYVYRADGRVSGYQSGNLQVAYYYDALGRLAAKAINTGASNFTQSYAYIGDRSSVLQTKAGDGTITSYLSGQGLNEYLAELKGGVFKSYVTDYLGSILNSEMAGSTHRFSLFGGPSGTALLSATSDPASFGYAGGMHNRESGSTKFDWRDLHHDTGRWGSMDPIGMAGDDLNFYRYVDNNPLLFTDPDGLAKICKYAIDAPGIPGAVGDFTNTEGAHEQVYFEDKEGGDLGFYPTADSSYWWGKGEFVPSGRNSTAGMSCDAKNYDDARMRKAVDAVKAQNDRYTLIPVIGNNCQSMMDRVRDRYGYIERQEELEKQRLKR